jgi:serine/threonine protein kinase
MPDSSLDEDVARHVRQAGMATDPQLAEGRKLAAEKALPLAEALVQLGVITSLQRETVEKKLEARRDHANELAGFKILKKLGEGGMGAVYLAQDPAGDRRVALKVLPKQHAEDPEFVQRFRREAEAATRLDHPNIIRAFSAGQDKGYHFIVMEYCEGESLKKRIDRAGFIPHGKATDIAIQVARGLGYAHAAGFIHRDVKPENIILTPAGTARILDLGLAKNLGDTKDSLKTVTGAALGTPHYISPEQARGDKSVDGRSDLYSLGATYYHAMTGQTPFSGTSIFEVIQKHLMEQLPDPRDLHPGIPDGVVAVLRRMMAKSPVDRYPTAGDLLADLEKLARQEAPLATAIDPALTSISLPSRRSTPPTPSRRRRLLVGGGAAALFALGMAIVWPSSKPGTEPPPSPPSELSKKKVNPSTPLAPAVESKTQEKKTPDAGPSNPIAAQPPILKAGQSASPTELPFDAFHPRSPDAPNTRWLELLPVVSVDRAIPKGQWQRTAEGILSPDSGQNWDPSRIWIPYSPSEEYEVVVTLERTQGTEDLLLGLIHQGKPFAVVLDGWRGSGASGAYLNGIWKMFPGAATHVIANDTPVRIAGSVRSGGFRLTVNGKEQLSFPDTRVLGLPENMKSFPAQADGLVIGSVRSTFKVMSIAILPIKGEGRVIPLGP